MKEVTEVQDKSIEIFNLKTDSKNGHFQGPVDNNKRSHICHIEVPEAEE